MQKRGLAFLLLGALGLALAACTTITEDLPAAPSPVFTPPPIIGPAPGTPTPNPNPTPTPAPTPTPSSSKVVKLGIKVERVVCNGTVLPNSEFATSAPVGCAIHFDATPKDAANKPTTPDGTPRWTFSPASLVHVNSIDPYAPIATGQSEGTLAVYAEVDGVKSETLTIQITK